MGSGRMEMLKQGGSGAVEGGGSEGEDWAKRGVGQDIYMEIYYLTTKIKQKPIVQGY